MNYQKIYHELMLRASSRELEDQIIEKHHWYPRSLYPDLVKEPTNIVSLTPREHLLAHWLLTKILPDSREMASAFWLMSNTRDAKLTPKTYQIAKERNKWACSIDRKGLDNWMSKPVDVYDYLTGELLASGVSRKDWAADKGYSTASASMLPSADLTKPTTVRNRHSVGEKSRLRPICMRHSGEPLNFEAIYRGSKLYDVYDKGKLIWSGYPIKSIPYLIDVPRYSVVNSIIRNQLIGKRYSFKLKEKS